MSNSNSNTNSWSNSSFDSQGNWIRRNSNSNSNANTSRNIKWFRRFDHFFKNSKKSSNWDPPTTLSQDKWEVVKLNTPPKRDIALNNFNNKNAKAIKVSWKENGKNYSDYYTPKTVAGLLGVRNIENWKVRRAMHLLYNTPPPWLVFRHPTTRKIVKRRNLNFVKLTRKRPSRPREIRERVAKLKR